MSSFVNKDFFINEEFKLNVVLIFVKTESECFPVHAPVTIDPVEE